MSEFAGTWVGELGEGCSADEWKDSCELLGKTSDCRRSAIAGDEKSCVHQDQIQKGDIGDTTKSQANDVLMGDRCSQFCQ